LDGHYVLEADIDLAAYETFESIGQFVPISEENSETPNLEMAFTGVFDGKGHKISNINISAGEQQMGVGLFGCVAGENGVVTNLVVENITVSGNMVVGGVIGWGDATNTIENITLQGNNTITGSFLVGGIVGGGFSDIKNCTATANITLIGDGAQGGGILAGGIEGEHIISSSKAIGTVSVTGNGSSSIGGLIAGGHLTSEIKNCTTNVTINITGEDCAMIGGLVGTTGTYEGNPTIISGCTVTATITVTGSNTQRIGGIVGSGYYLDMYKTDHPEPTAFIVRNSSSSGSITGGKFKGTIAGYIYNNSTVDVTCTSTMIGPTNQVGGAYPAVPLADLN
jgi:hypothetical protein